MRYIRQMKYILLGLLLSPVKVFAISEGNSGFINKSTQPVAQVTSWTVTPGTGTWVTSQSGVYTVTAGTGTFNVTGSSVTVFRGGLWNVGQVGSYTVTPGTGTQNINIVSTFSASNPGFVVFPTSQPVFGVLTQAQLVASTVTVAASTRTASVISYTGSNYTPSYSTGTVALAPAATPTDVCTLTGSATRTVLVTKVWFSASQTNTDLENVVLLRRSSANSAGTSISSNGTTYDTRNPAGTATARFYTANPTLGTMAGYLFTRKVLVIATAPLATTSSMDATPFYQAGTYSQNITLRGTSEVLSINLLGVTMTGGSINCGFEWVEI